MVVSANTYLLYQKERENRHQPWKDTKSNCGNKFRQINEHDDDVVLTKITTVMVMIFNWAKQYTLLKISNKMHKLVGSFYYSHCLVWKYMSFCQTKKCLAVIFIELLTPIMTHTVNNFNFYLPNFEKMSFQLVLLPMLLLFHYFQVWKKVSHFDCCVHQI